MFKEIKIAFGYKIKQGPWGGGNQFAGLLIEYLKKKKYKVVFDLNDPDIDIILMTDPRVSSSSSVFGPKEILDYLIKVNSNAIVVHRVNECDERKRTKTVNKQLFIANSVVDYTVYIGSWLINLFKNQGFQFSRSFSVIKNGADRLIFPFRRKRLPKNGKVRIITHHWSSNWMKGWDIYLLLDDLLDNKEFKSKFEFHYIGNIPRNLRIKNIIIHKPCKGKLLAQKLQNSHIYLTASINEPGGMHHIEGALCGLPLLYRKSGALPEYCRDFGIKFNNKNDFKNALYKLVKNYDSYAEKMKKYPNTAKKMCQEYFFLFKNLIHNKDKIIQSRNPKLYTQRHKVYIKLLEKYFEFLKKIGII